MPTAAGWLLPFPSQPCDPLSQCSWPLNNLKDRRGLNWVIHHHSHCVGVRWRLVKQQRSLPPILAGESPENRSHSTVAGAQCCGQHTEHRGAVGRHQGRCSVTLCHLSRLPTQRGHRPNCSGVMGTRNEPQPSSASPKPQENVHFHSLSFSMGFSLFSLAYDTLLAGVFLGRDASSKCGNFPLFPVC